MRKIFITAFCLLINICLDATATLHVYNLNDLPTDIRQIRHMHRSHQTLIPRTLTSRRQATYPQYLQNLSIAQIKRRTWCLVYVNGKILKIPPTGGKTALFRSGWEPYKPGETRYRFTSYTVVMFDWQRPPEISTPYQYIIQKNQLGWLAELRKLGYQVPRGLQAEIRKRLGDTEEVVTAYLLIRNILQRVTRGRAKTDQSAITIDIISSRDSCYSCMWLFLELIRIYQGRLTIRYSSTTGYTRASRRMRATCCATYPSVNQTYIPEGTAKETIPTRNPAVHREPLLFVYRYQAA